MKKWSDIISIMFVSLLLPSLMNASKSFGNRNFQRGYNFILSPYASHRLLAITIDEAGQKVIKGEINDVVSNPTTPLPRITKNTYPNDTISFVFSKNDTFGFTISLLESLLKKLNTKGLSLGFNWNNVDSVVCQYTGITTELIEDIPLQKYLMQLSLLSDYCCNGAACKKQIYGLVTEVDRSLNCTVTWYHPKGWGGNANLDAIKQVLGIGLAGSVDESYFTTFIHHESEGTGRPFQFKVKLVGVDGCRIVMFDVLKLFNKSVEERSWSTEAAGDTGMISSQSYTLFSELLPYLVLGGSESESLEEKPLYIILPAGSLLEEK